MMVQLSGLMLVWTMGWVSAEAGKPKTWHADLTEAISGVVEQRPSKSSITIQHTDPDRFRAVLAKSYAIKADTIMMELDLFYSDGSLLRTFVVPTKQGPTLIGVKVTLGDDEPGERRQSQLRDKPIDVVVKNHPLLGTFAQQLDDMLSGDQCKTPAVPTFATGVPKGFVDELNRNEPKTAKVLATWCDHRAATSVKLTHVRVDDVGAFLWDDDGGVVLLFDGELRLHQQDILLKASTRGLPKD